MTDRSTRAVLTITLLGALSSLGGAADDGEVPVPWRVYQRGVDGKADIPVTGLPAAASPRLLDEAGVPVPGVSLVRGMLTPVPAGGPYTVEVDGPPGSRPERIGPLFVGDLWVLAGQSNMEGRNDQEGAAAPHPKVAAMGLDGRWTQATDPIHGRSVFLDPIHAPTSIPPSQNSRDRDRGSGPGLAFATKMVDETGVPVGLIAAAKGATPMRKWDPRLKGDGGDSLYGAMLRQIDRAGGRVKGVLWYQGEGDAIGHRVWGEESSRYAERFEGLISGLRADLHDPRLPFFLVQIGRHVDPKSDPRGWSGVRSAQLDLAERLTGVRLVSAIDTDVNDGIHLDAPSETIVGLRLARAALHELFGKTEGTTPTFAGLETKGSEIRVRFRGVNRSGGVGLRGPRHLPGFSIRGPDQREVPLILKATLDRGDPDAVLLRINGALPEGVALWYGWGSDPLCDLADSLDMAVPAFGPIPLKGTSGVTIPGRVSPGFVIAGGSIGAVLAGGLLVLARRVARRRAARPALA